MLALYEPKYEDLWFRQMMLADEDTMSYNHAWGGTIPWSRQIRQATAHRADYCIFALYPSPHAHMESRIGLRLLPSSVREYSTFGGTSA